MQHRAPQHILLVGLMLSLISNIIEPGIADIFIALTIITAFFLPSTKAALKMPQSNSFKALTGLVALWVFANFLGYLLVPGFSSEQITEFLGLRWILAFYGMILVGLCADVELEILKKTLTICAVVTLITVVYQLAAVDTPDNRLQGTLGNANVFALSALLLWAFTVGVFFPKLLASKKNLISFAIPTIILTPAVYGTMTRSAWIGAAVAVLTLPFFYRSRKTLFALIALAVSVGTMWIFDIFGFQYRILYSMRFSTGNSQAMRLVIWKTNWEIFKDHPLFGVGFYENYRMIPDYYHRLGFDGMLVHPHAHNQYLQIMVGSGIVGFLAYLGIFAMAFNYFRKKVIELKGHADQSLALGSLLVIVAYLGASFTEAPLMLHSSRNYLLMFLGVSFGYLERKRLEKSIS